MSSLLSAVALILPFIIRYAAATTNVTSRTAPVGAEVLTVAVIGG
jgi:hypothetical protein